MHSVSNGWNLLQKEQLREATKLIFEIFNLENVPYMLGGSGSSLVPHCTELMACSFGAVSEEIIGVFQSAVDVDFDNVAYDCLHDDFTIYLYDGTNTLIYSGTLSSASGSYSGIYQIKITNNYSGANKLYYFALSQPTELTNSEIKNGTYIAHCSVINEDLPYHKVSFTTIQKSFPISKNVVGYFRVGYDSISKYIPLGCGYYYLDKQSYTNNGFEQQYNFIDILSTLTNKFRLMKIGETLTYKELAQRVLDGGTLGMGIYVLAGFPFKIIQNYNVSNLTTATTTKIPPKERTTAEVLQMVAQASNTILYVDESNRISFADNVNSKTDTNSVWVLNEEEITENEKIKRLTVNAYTLTQGQYKTFTTFTTKTAYNFVDFSGYVDIASPTATIYVDFYTYNFFMKFYTTSQTISIEGTEYTAELNQSVVYTINSEGEDLTLDCEFIETVNDSDFTNLQNFLSLNKTTSINTRHDCKYFVLDNLTNTSRCYSNFIIEDISVDFGNGCNGTIKGRITKERLRKPTIITITSSYIEIANSNSVDVELVFTATSTIYSGISIGANETLQVDYATYPLLGTYYQNWVAGALTRNVNVYAKDTNYLVSKNLVVFKKS